VLKVTESRYFVCTLYQHSIGKFNTHDAWKKTKCIDQSRLRRFFFAFGNEIIIELRYKVDKEKLCNLIPLNLREYVLFSWIGLCHWPTYFALWLMYDWMKARKVGLIFINWTYEQHQQAYCGTPLVSLYNRRPTHPTYSSTLIFPKHRALLRSWLKTHAVNSLLLLKGLDR
jgi:hypothetical protein